MSFFFRIIDNWQCARSTPVSIRGSEKQGEHKVRPYVGMGCAWFGMIANVPRSIWHMCGNESKRLNNVPD
ncbi:hypothetical protein ACTVJH_01980 [Desulfoplanes sp. PS50]